MLSERKGSSILDFCGGETAVFVCVSEGGAVGILPATQEPLCKLSALGGAHEDGTEKSCLAVTVLKLACKKVYTSILTMCRQHRTYTHIRPGTHVHTHIHTQCVIH